MAGNRTRQNYFCYQKKMSPELCNPSTQHRLNVTNALSCVPHELTSEEDNALCIRIDTCKTEKQDSPSLSKRKSIEKVLTPIIIFPRDYNATETTHRPMQLQNANLLGSPNQQQQLTKFITYKAGYDSTISLPERYLPEFQQTPEGEVVKPLGIGSFGIVVGC